MGGFAYYNEIDPFAVDWLRALIAAKAIPDGEVDPRSIALVAPVDLHGFTQCHFFAGIGGWAYALQLAEWPEDRPVWTGSCPCQPFSSAGKGEGGRDPRHLWPEWFRLIRECRPAVVFGEQVEAAIAHGWSDLVHADLEGEGYACGWAGLPAAGVGAPHIRGRVWFVADRSGERREWRQGTTGGCEHDGAVAGRPKGDDGSECSGKAGVERLAHPSRERRQQDPRGASGHEAADGSAGRDRRESDGDYQPAGDGEGGELGELANPQRDPRGPRRLAGQPGEGAGAARAGAPVESGRCGLFDDPATPSFWSPCSWLPCLDGKSRPVEPGTFPLAHGVPARVGRLRGYGNAIVPQVAEAFIRVYLAC